MRPDFAAATRSGIYGGLIVEAAPVRVVSFATFPASRFRCSGISISRIETELLCVKLVFHCSNFTVFSYPLNIPQPRLRPGALRRINSVQSEAYPAVGAVMAI
jgi:hypothetical protein